MEQINRLGWAAGMSFVSYGLRIGIRANKPEVLDRALNYSLARLALTGRSSAMRSILTLLVAEFIRPMRARTIQHRGDQMHQLALAF